MWLDEQISFYECTADNAGIVTTFRDVLLCQFAVPHKYYYKIYPENKITYPKGKWINGTVNDLHTIIRLRKENLSKAEQTSLKQTMQCYTPAGVLKSKKQGAIEEIKRTGIMQLDFDYKDIAEYDMNELIQCVFSLNFIAFCSMSCSGAVFYALALIAEPYKLKEYAEHCFNVLLKYGVKADTTKGRNVNDLRFVSYDGNMLIRQTPKPLQIKRFYSIKPAATLITSRPIAIDSNNSIVRSELKKLNEAQVGSRWETVQKAAFTLGGLGDSSLLDNIKSVIACNSAFANEELKYSKCAEDCFRAGMAKPLNTN